MGKADKHTPGLIRDTVPPSSCMTTRYLEGDENGVHIAKVGHMDYTSGDVYSDVANARRLAAAWNACDKLPTAELTAGLLLNQKSALADCLALLGKLCESAVALRDTPENATDEPSEELSAVLDWTDVHIRAAQAFMKAQGQTPAKRANEGA